MIKVYAEQVSSDDSEVDRLLKLAVDQDTAAMDRLFSRYRERLKRMVGLRLNRRLLGRVDESDIVQEALLVAAGKLAEYAANPRLPFFLWLRQFTCLKITEAHRTHLGTRKRDARREVSARQRSSINVDTSTLAGALIAKSTSISDVAIAAEQIKALQHTLEELEPFDREMIALKHFEQLTIAEIAEVLDMPRSTVGRRYLQALVRLRGHLNGLPEFEES